jgi:hypothetical protein
MGIDEFSLFIYYTNVEMLKTITVRPRKPDNNMSLILRSRLHGHHTNKQVKPGAQPTEGKGRDRIGREGKEIEQCYLYVTIHNRVVPEASVSCVYCCICLHCAISFPSVGCAPGLKL